MSNIQIRIDEKTKKNAKKVFDKLGIDMTAAIKLYLHQVTIRKAIPFVPITENGLDLHQEAAILKAEQDVIVGKEVTDPMSAREAIDYLKRL